MEVNGDGINGQSPGACIQDCLITKKPQTGAFLFGGERGIRTPGRFPVNGFQDRRFRPLSQLSRICVFLMSVFVYFSRFSSGGSTALFRASCPPPIRGQPSAVLICSWQISRPLSQLSRFCVFLMSVFVYFSRFSSGGSTALFRASCHPPLRGQPSAVLICSRQISRPLSQHSRILLHIQRRSRQRAAYIT